MPHPEVFKYGVIEMEQGQIIYRFEFYDSVVVMRGPAHDFRAADHDLGAGAIGSSGSRVARLSVRVSPSRCPSPARLLHAGNRE